MGKAFIGVERIHRVTVFTSTDLATVMVRLTTKMFDSAFASVSSVSLFSLVRKR